MGLSRLLVSGSIDDYSKRSANHAFFGARFELADLKEFFMFAKVRMLFVTGTKGGVEHKKAWGHHHINSFVFCLCLLTVGFQIADRAKSGKTIETPLETGGHAASCSGHAEMPLHRPQGVAIRYLSLREGSEQPHRSGAFKLRSSNPFYSRPPFPSPWMIPDRSSPSRVRFAASRPGLLRADPKRWLFTREMGDADQPVILYLI